MLRHRIPPTLIWTFVKARVAVSSRWWASAVASWFKDVTARCRRPDGLAPTRAAAETREIVNSILLGENVVSPRERTISKMKVLERSHSEPRQERNVGLRSRIVDEAPKKRWRKENKEWNEATEKMELRNVQSSVRSAKEALIRWLQY